MTTSAKAPPNDNNDLPFDAQKIAIIGREIIGSSKIGDYCEKTGLSRSIVSKIINGTMKRPPKINTIVKFLSDNTEYSEQLLIACGYPKDALDKRQNSISDASKFLKPKKCFNIQSINLFSIFFSFVINNIQDNNPEWKIVPNKHVGDSQILVRFFDYKDSALKNKRIYDTVGNNPNALDTYIYIFQNENKDKGNNEHREFYIGIPALCHKAENPTDIVIRTIDWAKHAIIELETPLENEKNKKTLYSGHKYYYILTNSYDVYDTFLHSFPNLILDIHVLLTDGIDIIDNHPIPRIDKK